MRNRALLSLAICGLLALGGCERASDPSLSDEHRENPGALTPTERRDNVHVENEPGDPDMTHSAPDDSASDTTDEHAVDPGTYPPGATGLGE